MSTTPVFPLLYNLLATTAFLMPATLFMDSRPTGMEVVGLSLLHSWQIRLLRGPPSMSNSPIVNNRLRRKLSKSCYFILLRHQLVILYSMQTSLVDILQSQIVCPPISTLKTIIVIKCKIWVLNHNILCGCAGFLPRKWNESGFRPPLCTYRLNWARRTSWGWWDEWDDTVLQTQDSKFEPWRSEAEHATSRSRRLPTILTFTRGWGRNIFVSLKPPRPGTEPRTLAWKAAVLTTTLGPPPLSATRSVDIIKITRNEFRASKYVESGDKKVLHDFLGWIDEHI